MRNGYGDKMRNEYGDKMRNGYGDKMRNGYVDKMRHFNEFFRLIFTFLCFLFVFFCNGCNVVLTSVTETIVKCAIWVLKG